MRRKKTMMKGIDISDNQGYIDWKKVKAAGVEFAILRSTRGSGSPDKQLASNIKGCQDNGIPMEFYKYSYAMTNSEAKKEALRVVEVLKQYGIEPSQDTIIWADIEYNKQLALGKQAVWQIYDNFKEIILNSGYGIGLYMGKYAYENQFDGSRISDRLWLARYYAGDTIMQFGALPDETKKPAAAAGSRSMLNGWQFTSHGRVSGIKGNVDMNIRYTDCGNVKVEPQYYDTPEFTLIDCLNKIGADSSYRNRKKIAIANGIENYSGTAAQNTEMLILLQRGKLIR